jgi:YegS/Rv2252/BmrU family lipid kinase
VARDPVRAFAVVNPAAGGGRSGRAWPALHDQLVRDGVVLEWAETSSGHHARGLARQAARAGWPIVVAVGGDGTVNEVLNGLLESGGAAALGAVLTGRGRDTARNFGLPRDPAAAARRLVEGRDRRVDVVALEWPDGARRFALGVAGAGFDAEVARRTAGRGGAGGIAYFAAVITSLGAHRPLPVRVSADGTVWEGRATAVVVANGRYFGGGMRIAPDADPADGVLDLVVLGDLGRAELLCWLPSVYRGGHVRHPRVSIRRVRTVTIEAPTAMPVHVDGEAAGVTPLRLGVRPGAIALRG